MANAVEQPVIDRILEAMPATRREIRMRLGVTKGIVQNIVEKLRAASWLHVGGWVREWSNGTGRFTEVLHAGPGADVPCDLEPLTQKSRDERRYKKLVETGAIVERIAGNKRRARAKRIKRKQQLAAWAAPLTVVVSKPRPAKSFPKSVELENI